MGRAPEDRTWLTAAGEEGWEERQPPAGQRAEGQRLTGRG